MIMVIGIYYVCRIYINKLRLLEGGFFLPNYSDSPQIKFLISNLSYVLLI